VDEHGRFLLGRVVVVCPARGGSSCQVTVRQVDTSRLHILPLAFDIPSGRSSKIRLRLTAGSLHELRRLHSARAAVEITARQGLGPPVRKRVRLRLLAPRHEPRPRLRGRALTGRPIADPDAPAPGAASGGSDGGLTVGISEQWEAMFGDPRFRALGVKTARLVVAWNAIWQEPDRVASWLNSAAASGVQPLVAFDHDRADRCPAAPCALPSVEAYEAAVRAFLAAHPQVRLITPWNEANHAAEPTAGRPDRAAAYYNAARRACPSCTLVAADVIDGTGMLGWLAAYKDGLNEAPQVWGLHDYYDTTYFTTSGLRDYLGAVTGQVWLTETGGIVELRTREGQVSLPHDELRARASVSFAFEEARAFASRVGRMYLYQWRADSQGRFDAGLIRPDGSSRPALEVVRAQLAETAGPSGTPGASVSASGAPGPPRALPGPVTVRASGASDVRLRCPAGVSGRCVGRLWVEDVALQTVTLVNGRVPAYVLRPMARSFALAPRRGSRVRFAVPRSVLVPAWSHRQLRLRLMVASPDEPFALRARWRADAWRPPNGLSPRRRAR
jgi:hypothetical protein